eukprot:TRINITY_DN21514_c0_g1_i1.p1 TRINITY_DN21514_c0_g1~~TRINITY_DN21514_c0_g1_i1.p1  ORF type:complete len:314 (+),score=78.39 TRINITY_DN21514_c0_g1_i1:84-1025(+)
MTHTRPPDAVLRLLATNKALPASAAQWANSAWEQIAFSTGAASPFVVPLDESADAAQHPAVTMSTTGLASGALLAVAAEEAARDNRLPGNVRGASGGTSSSTTCSSHRGRTENQKRAELQAMEWFRRIDTSNKAHLFTRRMMGELVRMFVDKEHEDFIEFHPPVADDLSVFHFTLKTSAAEEGSKLRASLEKHRCHGIKCEMLVPPEFPCLPVFIRVLHPQLTGGNISPAGGVCFEPLTLQGHTPAMSLASLCVGLQAYFNQPSFFPLTVQRTSPDDRIAEYNLEDAAREAKRMESQREKADKWMQQPQNLES